MTDNNRILVVDDDLGVRAMYEDILSPSQSPDIMPKETGLSGEPEQNPAGKLYDLILADNGEEGVQQVEMAVEQKKPFAAAFIDMNMPGIDGAETSKRIWRIDSNIKIVIVTAYSEYKPGDITRLTGRDDIFYLRKPFAAGEIRQFARAFTNQWNLEREKELSDLRLERANKELDDMNKNLRKKVEEQTTLLVQSEKMVSMGILAAGIAHEINNPISFVSGNMSTLKKYSARITELLQKYKELETCLIYVGTGMFPSANDPEGLNSVEGPGPETHNRLGSFVGPMAASFQVNPPGAPPKGDLETAEAYGKRVAETTLQFVRGRSN